MNVSYAADSSPSPQRQHREKRRRQRRTSSYPRFKRWPSNLAIVVLNTEKDPPIVLVCKTDKRSAKAAELLRERGFEQVSVLRGGMEGWSQSGFVER